MSIYGLAPGMKMLPKFFRLFGHFLCKVVLLTMIVIIPVGAHIPTVEFPNSLSQSTDNSNAMVIAESIALVVPHVI